MKKKIFAITAAVLMTAGSLFAQQFIYIINCGNGKVIRGYMSAVDRDEAVEVAKGLAEVQC